EHALAPPEHVDHLVVGVAGEDRCAVADEGHAAQIGAECPQVVDRLADALEADPRVEELLDELEFDQVLEGVEALAARPHCRLDAGCGQPGSSPVIKLPVADADDLADIRPAVPGRRDSLWHGEGLRSCNYDCIEAKAVPNRASRFRAAKKP